MLVLFRSLAALGIGGEWSVGASLVAETVPENRRVMAATLVYTSSPLGIILASTVNYQIAGVWMVDSPESSWRYVFLCGLAPVVVALFARLFIKESEVVGEERSHLGRHRSFASCSPAPSASNTDQRSGGGHHCAHHLVGLQRVRASARRHARPPSTPLRTASPVKRREC